MRKMLSSTNSWITQILALAATGTFIAGSLIMPGLPKILKLGKDFDFSGFLEEDNWEPFDERRLRQRIKELQKRKMVKIYQTREGFVVRVTKKGKQKFLKHRLDDLSINKPRE